MVVNTTEPASAIMQDENGQASGIDHRCGRALQGFGRVRRGANRRQEEDGIMNLYFPPAQLKVSLSSSLLHSHLRVRRIEHTLPSTVISALALSSNGLQGSLLLLLILLTGLEISGGVSRL